MERHDRESGLRRLRRERGFSQAGLARAAHLSERTIRSIEQDPTTVTIATVLALADALAVPPAVIVEWMLPPPPTPRVSATPRADAYLAAFADLIASEPEIAELIAPKMAEIEVDILRAVRRRSPRVPRWTSLPTAAALDVRPPVVVRVTRGRRTSGGASGA